MTSPLEQRIKAALRGIADQPVIRPAPPAVMGRRSRRPLWTQLAAAMGVLVLMLIIVVRPSVPSAPPAGTREAAVVPKTFAAFSMLTAKLSTSPLRQAGIAIVAQGKSGITGLFTQVIVIGADGRTYRRVDLAEDRGARRSGGDAGEWQNAQAVLSPDGQRLAIGQIGFGATEIPVLNLVTGERRDYRLPKPLSYAIADWSRDGRKLAISVVDEPVSGPDPYSGAPDRMKVAVLDLDSGAISLVPGLAARQFVSAQFGPSGRLFTLMSATVRIADFSRVPEGEVHEIAQLHADVLWWSPDETQVAVWSANDSGTTIRVKDLSGQEVRAPVFFADRVYCDPISWRGQGKLLLFDKGARELIELDFQTGQTEVLSRFDDWIFGEATGVAFASRLIENARFEETSPQRGPWPWWTWAGIVIAGLVVYAIVRRQRRPKPQSRRSFVPMIA